MELDLLLERSNEITKQADERNRRNTARSTNEVSEQWSKLISDLENRRNTLTKLAQFWETFEGRWQHFESLLTGIQERVKHVDFIIRNKEHVILTTNNILVKTSGVCGVKCLILFNFRNCNRKQYP